MTEILTSYAATVIIAWAFLWRTWWTRMAAKVAAGEVKDVAQDALDNIHTKQVLILMVGAAAFLVAFAWPALVAVVVVFRLVMWLLHLGHSEK